MAIDAVLLQKIRDNQYTSSTLSFANQELTERDLADLVEALQTNLLITALDLTNTRLTTKKLSQLAEIKLESLSIVGNDLGPDVIPLLNQMQLRILDISANPLGDAVSGLRDLSHLVARECDITDAGAAVLFHSPSLQSLDLATNEIRGECLRQFPQNTILRELGLSQNPLQRECCDYLGRNQSLRVLDLTNVIVGDVGAMLLAKSTSLQEVYLIQCGITDAGATALSENNSFKKLSLYGNTIGRLGGQAFAKNKQLLHLCLRGNPGPFVELEARYQDGFKQTFTRTEDFATRLPPFGSVPLTFQFPSPEHTVAAVISTEVMQPFLGFASPQQKDAFLDELSSRMGIDPNKRPKRGTTII